jgi:hypothetical protein
MTTRANAPESQGLTLADAEIFENARQAIMTLKKTFEMWMVIGKAVQRARKIADDRGGRQTFQRLLEQQGLAKIVSQKSTWTRLLQIMDNLAEVVAWHETLTDKQKIEWAAPTTVFKHCPVFNKPAKTDEERAANPSPMAKVKEANVALNEENAKLKRDLARRQDGDRFKASDTARNIAVVLMDMFSFSPRKAEEIIREWKKLIPRSVPSTPNPKPAKGKRGAPAYKMS